MLLGHEIAGEVTAVGEGVTDWRAADRVGVWATPQASVPGCTRHGGYAERHLAPAADLIGSPVTWTSLRAPSGPTPG